MKIHKEGRQIAAILLILTLLSSAITIAQKETNIVLIVLSCLLFLFTLIIVFFYRYPDRQCNINENVIYVPADGEVVACEKVFEKDYFKAEMLQISVFMSIYNVHVNWAPVAGKIVWKLHKDGQNYPARNPKSSELNEVCKTVIRLNNGKEVMVNQIAGIMARRVVNDKEVGETIKQGDELGIIKFGSRVDLYIPLESDIKINIGQKVKAITTVAATI